MISVVSVVKSCAIITRWVKPPLFLPITIRGAWRRSFNVAESIEVLEACLEKIYFELRKALAKKENLMLESEMNHVAKIYESIETEV